MDIFQYSYDDCLMTLFSPEYVLIAALILDMLFADPRLLPHPVRWMGHAISLAEPVFRSLPVRLVRSGFLFASILIIGTYLTTWFALKAIHGYHPLWARVAEVVLIYYSISMRSLSSAAEDVIDALEGKGLLQAKAKLAFIVGRDTEPLTESGIKRATIETVAENLVDGVMAPLFYAAIGGAPLSMAYKMINTLDSMVGYKNSRYRDFGKAGARYDDVANYIPARLSVPVIALAAQVLGKTGWLSLKTALKEGSHHSSPNAGWPEAAFSGALRVCLNGPNYYHGERVDKPYIGQQFGRRVAARQIKQACDLMLLSSVLWVLILSAVIWVVS